MMLAGTELLPRLEYPVACTDIKASRDMKHLVSCGVYRPAVKIHSLPLQSVILDRNIQNEPIEVVLIDGVCRYGILTSGNRLELHNRTGMRRIVKVPMNCRSAVYWEGAVAIGGDRGTLERYEVARDVFTEPFDTGLDEAVKVCGGPGGLLGICGTHSVGFLDARSGNAECTLAIGKSLTAFDVADEGFCVGCDDGCVYMYDLRTHRRAWEVSSGTCPKAVKACGEFLVCGGERSLKVWRGTELVAEERVPGSINAVEVVGPLVFAGLEFDETRVLYVPDMGDPPAWCRFIKEGAS